MTTTTEIVTVPPVNTEPYIPPNDFTTPMNQLIVAIILSLLFVVAIIWVLRRGTRTKDMDPTLDDIMVESYDPNKAAIVMMILVIPLMITLMIGVQMLWINAGLGMALIIGGVTFTLLPYFMGKLSSREATRNKKKMEGTLYLKDGSKRKYRMINVDFDMEKGMKKADREALLAYVDEDAEIELDEEGMKKPRTPILTAEELDKLHPVRALVNKIFQVYFLFEEKFADAINWLDDTEYDYYGSYLTKADSPVLQEICKIRSIRDSSEDSSDKINEFCFVFWVMFDDSHALKRMAATKLVDLSDNELLMGVSKIIGAERVTIAAEVNTLNAELALEQEHSIDFEDIIKSVGIKKAIEFRDNETNLTSVDLSAFMGMQVGIVTTLILAVASLLLGIVLGSGGLG